MATLEQLTIPMTALEKMELRRELLLKQVERSEREWKALTKQIEVLQKEADELRKFERGFGRTTETGKIAKQKEELAELELLIADEQKPLVYWSMYGGNVCKEPTSKPSSWGPDSAPYVVDKVTAKRIYIRKKGGDQVSQYGHDGKSVSRYQRDQIAIAKTFPEGIKCTK